MTQRQNSDGNPDGNVYGQSPSDKIAFYGGTPIAQRSGAAQAAVAGSAGGTYTATEQTLINNLATLANELRATMVALNAIKGSA
jgi:hypothetical protein